MDSNSVFVWAGTRTALFGGNDSTRLDQLLLRPCVARTFLIQMNGIETRCARLPRSPRGETLADARHGNGKDKNGRVMEVPFSDGVGAGIGRRFSGPVRRAIGRDVPWRWRAW